MSIKEIKEAIESNRVYYGMRQTVRHQKKLKGVFITKDAREETTKKLEEAKISFTVLKPKTEMSKELNINFQSEIFSLY